MSSNPNQPQANKGSPGKGGKSLQLMQQRMQQSQSQSSTSSNPPPAESPSPAAVPAARSKGKDFANMSAANNRPQMPGQVPQMPGQAPPTQQISAGAGGKSKGKDFSAMASRMPPAQVQQPAQQQPSPKQLPTQMTPAQLAQAQAARDRAASLQAEARKAAGLPPLDRPTATAVNIIPPNIPPPRPPLPMDQQQPQQQVMSASQASLDRAPVRKSTSPKSKVKTAMPTPSEAFLLKTVTSVTQTPPVGPKIQELVRSIDPNYTIHPDAEDQLLQLADDFLDKVVKQASRLATHRNSKALDVQDVQMVLSKQWGIVVPGLGPPPSKKPKTLSATKKRSSSTATH